MAVRRWVFPAWPIRALPLACVVLAGFALRIYDITRTPPELIVDELDLYNSIHSIATTGHDVDGTLLPFFASAFTRNPPLYALAEWCSSLVFGNGAFGLRLPAVLFGTIAIGLMYALAFELTRRRDVALPAAIVMATAPIFVHFSRLAWEPDCELPFLLAGAYFLVRAFVRAGDVTRARAIVSGRDLALGATFLALTCYTYMAGWFYAAALALPIVVLNARRLRSRGIALRAAAAAALGLVLAWPALWMWFANQDTYARTQRIATFGNGVRPDTIVQFFTNYLAHFRWSYLVTTGDPVSGSTWRYLNGFGAFYWWTIPLAGLGLVTARRYLRAAWTLPWLVWWVAIYPLGGSLTNEGVPNAPRTLAGTPVFCILAALGVAALFEAVARFPEPRRVLRVVCLANVALSVALFAQFYFTKFDYIAPNMWDSGTHDLFGVIREHARENRRLCFSIRPAWYGTVTYERYYLSDVPIAEIEDLNDPRCYLPGTLLATDTPLRRPGFRTIASVPEIGGLPFGYVSER